MPPWMRNPWFVGVDGTPPEPPGAGGGNPPPQPPAPTPADQASYWAKAKEAGESAANAAHSARMKALFGTDDPAQIEAIAKKVGGKNPDQPDERLKTIMDELDRVKAENTKLVSQTQTKETRDKVLAEIMGSSHRLHDVNETLEMLMLRYDFKMLNDKLVMHYKDSGNPVFLEGSNIGTTTALIESWAKDPKQAWRFNTNSQIATPSGQGGGQGPDAGNYTYTVKPEDFSLPGFAEALKKSGQQQLAYEGKPIDYDKLKPFLRSK